MILRCHIDIYVTELNTRLLQYMNRTDHIFLKKLLEMCQENEHSLLYILIHDGDFVQVAANHLHSLEISGQQHRVQQGINQHCCVLWRAPLPGKKPQARTSVPSLRHPRHPYGSTILAYSSTVLTSDASKWAFIICCMCLWRHPSGATGQLAFTASYQACDVYTDHRKACAKISRSDGTTDELECRKQTAGDFGLFSWSQQSACMPVTWQSSCSHTFETCFFL